MRPACRGNFRANMMRNRGNARGGFRGAQGGGLGAGFHIALRRNVVEETHGGAAARAYARADQEDGRHL